MEDDDLVMLVIINAPNTLDISKLKENIELKTLKCPSINYMSVFGNFSKGNKKLRKKKNAASKWQISLSISDFLDDPSVLIEGVLFRARYLGSTQLVCEGQPTKSTRMCQAEEAVSRIKVS